MGEFAADNLPRKKIMSRIIRSAKVFLTCVLLGVVISAAFEFLSLFFGKADLGARLAVLIYVLFLFSIFGLVNAVIFYIRYPTQEQDRSPD